MKKTENCKAKKIVLSPSNGQTPHNGARFLKYSFQIVNKETDI